MPAIERSHILDHALLFAGRAGRTRNKRRVVKNRFKSPHVTLASKGGKSFRVGKWHCGHRHNNHHK